MNLAKANLASCAACALVIALAACSSSGQKAGLASGFYRYSDGVTVYSEGSPESPCVVTSMAQLQAYGSVQKVKIVDHSVDLVDGTAAPPACPWPDGRYRQPDSNFVIRIEGAKACKMPVSTATAGVTIVSASDLLLTGKTLVPDCSALSQP